MTDRELRCPACDGPMRPVERRGVLIDICRDCRGVFLDRGELDKLLDAAPSELGPADEPVVGRRDERDEGWTDERDREWERQRGGRRRRRGGWLEDIFDFD